MVLVLEGYRNFAAFSKYRVDDILQFDSMSNSYFFTLQYDQPGNLIYIKIENLCHTREKKNYVSKKILVNHSFRMTSSKRSSDYT